MPERATPGRLPDDVARFLAEHIRTVDQLEILLLLHADGGRLWSPPAIGAELRRPDAAVVARLELLLSHGLVERDGRQYRYGPGRHDPDVDAAERCFATRRPAVIAAIYAEREDGGEADAAPEPGNRLPGPAPGSGLDS